MNNNKKIQEGSCRAKSYRVPEGIECEKFQLSEEKFSGPELEEALKQLDNYIKKHQEYFMGFQANQKLDYTPLQDYLKVHINNIGDPFGIAEPDEAHPDGFFTLNSKWMERAVLDYYAKLWHAKYPHLTIHDVEKQQWEETYWGYTLSMGSTEGNIFAVQNARDYLNGTRLFVDVVDEEGENGAGAKKRGGTIPAKFLKYRGPTLKSKSKKEEEENNEYTPVLFFSEAAHYSLIKISNTLMVKTFHHIGEEKYEDECPLKEEQGLKKGEWPEMVPVNPDGTVHIDKLCDLVEFFAEKGYPSIVVFNYGNTTSGAYDDVATARERLEKIFKKYGLYEREVTWKEEGEEITSIRKGYWLIVDGALGVPYAPFLQNAVKDGDLKSTATYPEFDFRQDIQSIVMSGHKWPGAPCPCGVYMTLNKYLLAADTPEYVGSIDSTLAGSRDGFSAIILWYFLATHSYKDQEAEAKRAVALAKKTYEELLEMKEAGKIETARWVDGSLAVLFSKPNDTIIKKFSLSCMPDPENDPENSDDPEEPEKWLAHIFIMGQVTEKEIEELIKDLKEPGAFSEVSKPGPLEGLRKGW